MDARVHPCLIPNDHLFANVNNVINAVYLQCDNLGPTLQTGAGAGRLPTASAVVADLVCSARSTDTGKRASDADGLFNKDNAATLVPIEDTFSRYYLRFHDAWRLRRPREHYYGHFQQNDISIRSIIQRCYGSGNVSIVVVSERTQERKVPRRA